MATGIFDQEVAQALAQARAAGTRNVTVNGNAVSVPYPYPSPADWRDCWIYFLMLDRFANDQTPPTATWNQRYGFRQGGTFNGVTAQLDYLKNLGAKAIWLSPVLKNSRPPDWEYNYHGYGAQDFLNVDERFASDGTRATAEQELTELVAQAHARGMYVVLDMVINHAARVFDYLYNGQPTADFTDSAIMNLPLGQEPAIQWMNGLGFPRADWQNQIPAGTVLSPDDAVYPTDLQRAVFFRRRGNRLSDHPPQGGFVTGDFDTMRQMVVEYDAKPPDQAALRAAYGSAPVLNILIRAYQYLIAKYDFDGFRIDTVKYVSPPHVETFGNAIREFAQAIGKRNFFTFGEIYDDEGTIERFVGRDSTAIEGFGIDAALDFPLFYSLPAVVKNFGKGVEAIAGIFQNRKLAERNLISSHGEAGQYFVTFLDNHDQNQRFGHPLTPQDQVTMGLAVLLCLQGIPAIYYGTEQGLNGTVDANGNPDLQSPESVREALWGKPNPFNSAHPLFQQIQKLAALRDAEPALRYGRIYFREVSGNGQDFGQSTGAGGLIAFSRILSDREIVVVANTNTQQAFNGWVLQDPDLNRAPHQMQVVYSNLGTNGQGTVRQIPQANFYANGQLTGTAAAAAIFVGLAPMEVQVLGPV